MLTSENVNVKLEGMLRDGISPLIVEFIRLQFMYGLRISDLLSIEKRNILDSGLLVVHQSKHSRTLTCNLLYNWDFWKRYKANGYYDIRNFDRFFFYRLYRKYGLIVYYGYGRKSSVTHAARKILANETYIASGDITIVQDVLGHKNINSTEYYLPEVKRSTIKQRGILAPVVGTNNGMIFKVVNGKNYGYMKKK